jgi:hypothetical protein
MMPQLPQKPDRFKRGTPVSAEALNKINQATDRQIRSGGDTDVSYYGDRVVVRSSTPHPQIPGLDNYVSQFVVLEEFDDYLLCTPFYQPFADDLGQWQVQKYDANLGKDSIPQVYVAKPYNLQRAPWDGKSVNAVLGTSPTDLANPGGFFTYIGVGQRLVYSTFGCTQFPVTATPGGTLSQDVKYYYSIVQTLDEGVGVELCQQFSNIESFTPTDATSAAVLTWEAIDGTVAQGFYIYRSLLPENIANPDNYIGKTAGNVFTFTDTGSPVAGPVLSASLVPGSSGFENPSNAVPMYYIVTPVISGYPDISPEGPASNEVSVTPDDTSIVHLSWSAFPGARGYNIYRSEVSGEYTGGASGGGNNPAPGALILQSIEGAGPPVTPPPLFIDDTNETGGAEPNYMQQFVGVFETQNVVPSYPSGEPILAVLITTGLYDPDGQDVVWMDLNTAGRLWLELANLIVDAGGPVDAQGTVRNVQQISFGGNNGGMRVTSDVSPGQVHAFVSLVWASNSLTGIVNIKDQCFSGVKGFTDGYQIGGSGGEGVNAPTMLTPCILHKMNSSLSPASLFATLSEDAIFFHTGSTFNGTSCIMQNCVYETDTGGISPVVTQTGFGFGPFGSVFNAASPGIQNFWMRLFGDPFIDPMSPDPTQATGQVLGYTLFTGTDGSGNKYINGLRVV